MIPGNKLDTGAYAREIFAVGSERTFNRLALELFRIQAEKNPVYRDYLAHLRVKISSVDSPDRIPFLPVECFKNFEIRTGDFVPEIVFSSSGTTGTVPSKHAVASREIYRISFRKGFEQFYGPVTDYCILALLPSYLEREGSSLVFMMEDLIKRSGHPMSGFYLHNLKELGERLETLKSAGQKTLLFGATFALLDLAETLSIDFPQLVVMETGGMKGRGEEPVRAAVHERLKKSFGVPAIHSEYGMTELLSQAYSKGEGLFQTVPWMKVLIRDVNDPLSCASPGSSGGINIIDLANMDSCCFLATQDLGRVYPDGRFEVLGRYDFSDVRGCNLLVL